jgi:hypothetical protein
MQQIAHIAVKKSKIAVRFAPQAFAVRLFGYIGRGVKENLIPLAALPGAGTEAIFVQGVLSCRKNPFGTEYNRGFKPCAQTRCE